MKNSIAAATVVMGSVLSPANAQQSHVERHEQRDALVQHQDPPFDPFQTTPTPQGQASQGNSRNPDLDVCCGASVLLVGGIAALAARGKKREEQLLSENRKKSEKWFEPGREDRRR